MLQIFFDLPSKLFGSDLFFLLNVNIILIIYKYNYLNEPKDLQGLVQGENVRNAEVLVNLTTFSWIPIGLQYCVIRFCPVLVKGVGLLNET